jgi:hypothetical protein
MRDVEHTLTRSDDVGGAAVVHVGGMQEREADVVALSPNWRIHPSRPAPALQPLEGADERHEPASWPRRKCDTV